MAPPDPNDTTAIDGILHRRFRRRLTDELAADGDLRTEVWRAAVEAVPRHLFVPAFFRQLDGHEQTLWEPTTPNRIGAREWLDLAYTNETWVTQLNHTIAPDSFDTPSPGIPTSSSTLPGLVVMMLEELDIKDHSRVLEIGTGTGYSTALLSHRLGEHQVTSVEVDPDVAAKAATNLRKADYRPNLVVGDGMAGHAHGAPYDRIIATCSVRHLPDPWIAQTKPGGQILTTLSGWLEASSGLLRLHVTGNGTAEGRFLGDQISFMPARSHEHPPLSPDVYDLVGDTTTATERPTTITARALNPSEDWTAAFIAQLAVPTAQRLSFSTDHGPTIDYLVDEQHHSYAALLPQPDGTHHVRQRGPVALWDAIEDSLAAWQQGGSPGLDHFQLTVTPAAQTVRFAASTGVRTWHLP